MKILIKFITNLGSLVLICTMIWLGWKYLGPVKPPVSDIRRQAAMKIMPQVVEDIRKNRGDIKTARFLHLANDPSDFVTSSLRQRLELAGTLDLGDRTLETKAETLLNLPIPVAGDLSQALEMAKNSKAQAVLFGTVNNFEEVQGGAVLNMELTLATLPEGRIVWTQRYASREASGILPKMELPASLAGEHSFFSRLFCWVLLVLLLPIFSIQFLRMMLRKKSNAANASMLALYTTLDALLAALLLTGSPSTWPVLLIFFGTIAAAFLYNVWIMSFALKLEE